MTLQQLRYAIEIDKTKNFAQAALSLNIAQPTLSLQIQKLEREIKIKLFDRSKTPISTLPEAKQFIDQAKLTLHEADKLDYMFSNQESKIAGEIRIGIIPTIAGFLLSKLIIQVDKKYPDLKLKLFEIPTTEILSFLEAQKLDLGILATPLNMKNFKEYPLYYEPFVAYLPPSMNFSKKEISIDQFNEKEIFVLGDVHCFREQALRVCKNSGLGRIEAGSFETIKKLVDSDLGLTLLPSFEEVKDETRKKKISGISAAREVSIITANNYYKTNILKVIQGEIISFIPKEFLSKKNFEVIGVTIN